MLTLSGVAFEEDTSTRQTAFNVNKQDGKWKIGINVEYMSNVFEDEDCSPCICINSFETDATQPMQLVGKTFVVEDIETADEREDLFYLFEEETFVEYKLTILDATKDTVRVECIGTAVTDGYEDSYETAKFHMDCWLPIITSAEDWAKFER